MSDNSSEGNKRNVIVTWPTISGIDQKLQSVSQDVASITVKVEQALALKSAFDAMDIRLRTLEVNQAVSSREGAKSSQVWQTVFHGITTLATLVLATLALFFH